jgi:hypothetical protein
VWRFGVPVVTPRWRPLLAADYNFMVRYGDTGGPARVEQIYRTLRAVRQVTPATGAMSWPATRRC